MTKSVDWLLWSCVGLCSEDVHPYQALRRFYDSILKPYHEATVYYRYIILFTAEIRSLCDDVKGLKIPPFVSKPITNLNGVFISYMQKKMV